MSGKRKPHVEAHAEPASGTGTAHEVSGRATFDVSATEEAQHQLGRRLAPVTKEANDARRVGKEASIARAVELSSAGKSLTKIALDMGTSPRQVSKWLKQSRERAE